MTTGRYGQSATLLQNSQVLVVGGNTVSFPELYDPSSGQFTAVAEPCRCVSFQPVKGDAAKQNPRLLTMLDFPREAGATLSGIAFPKSSSSPL
jgi:hypothetical protein